MNLLLLSNSTNYGDPYLHHAKEVISQFLHSVKKVLFIPYAGVTVSKNDYEATVKRGMSGSHLEWESIHHFDDLLMAVNSAEAIAVGGGNTFQLLATLQKLNLMEAISDKVQNGTPYVGWSAGSNIAGPTICTSNDMPIVEPNSFKALHFVPFQINPHYTDKTIPNHGGETRLDRLREYITLNSDKEVLCMPEGTWFEVLNNRCEIGGGKSVWRLRHGRDLEVVNNETYRSYLDSI